MVEILQVTKLLLANSVKLINCVTPELILPIIVTIYTHWSHFPHPLTAAELN